MRLIAALNRERTRRHPLPEPLPDEPPVPFEYLIRLYTTVSNPDYLTPRDQAALVAQLQVGLGEDGQHEAARADIVMLLSKLHDREDATHRTRTDVEAILASIGAESRPQPHIATETITPVEEQLGAITPPVSTRPSADTEHELSDEDRATADRPTDTDLRTEPDDHRVIATAPAREPTSSQASEKSSDAAFASAIRTTPAPSTTRPPLFQRMTRRTKFVLGAVAMFVATAVAVIAILIGSNTTSPGGPASSTAPTGPVGVQRLTAELKAADSTPVATATFDFSYGRATVTVKRSARRRADARLSRAADPCRRKV